jgi:glycosyltransferase involved in cell wall biosynthesis
MVVTALGCGGAERRITSLADGLSARGHRVDVAVLHAGSPFFTMDEQVEVRFFERDRLDRGGPIQRAGAFVRRPVWLARTLRASRPDVVVSFIDVANTITLLATLGSGLPVVVSERTYPPSRHLPWQYEVLRRLLYPRAARVVVQTGRAADWAKAWLEPSRVVVLPNPVPRQRGGIDSGGVDPDGVGPDGPDDRGRALRLPPGRWIAGMGRLHPLKGFDLLIEVFAGLAQRHPGWGLVLLGEGEERPRLEHMVQARGLGGRVLLPGQVHGPAAVLRQCHLFALTSSREGFPNALCEAMACGLAPVSFDCAAGPGEIIRHGVDGLLVQPGDADGLARGLERLMRDEALRQELAARAAEVCDRFDEALVLDRWVWLLEAVAGRA